MQIHKTCLHIFGHHLQVVNREKKFVSATPIPGTIIVNIADLMQRWTADKFVSTVCMQQLLIHTYSQPSCENTTQIPQHIHITYYWEVPPFWSSSTCGNFILHYLINKVKNISTLRTEVLSYQQKLSSEKLTTNLVLVQVHRVIIPEEELKRRTPRRSVAFFYDPDWKAKITCLDGSNKYPPIKCGKYVQQIMKGTFSF